MAAANGVWRDPTSAIAAYMDESGRPTSAIAAYMDESGCPTSALTTTNQSRED